MSSSSDMPILTYFHVPGRGEIPRLMFTLGKVDFQDKRVDFSDWQALKPTTPFGQLPLLQIGDTVVAQSAAIDHYAAKLAGFLPEDPLLALLSDQAYFFVTQDIHAALISPIMRMAPEDQATARQELSAPQGPLRDKLALLDELVASRSGKFIAGDKLSIGDFAIFNFLGMIKSEFWKGIPPELVSAYSALRAFRNEIATLPEVAAYYAAATDELRVKGYRPDEE